MFIKNKYDLRIYICIYVRILFLALGINTYSGLYTQTRNINDDSFIETEILQTKYNFINKYCYSIYNYPFHDL